MIMAGILFNKHIKLSLTVILAVLAVFFICVDIVCADEVEVTLNKTVYTYSGKAIKPEVTVTDQDGKVKPHGRYEIKYLNNVNAGKASVVVTIHADEETGTPEYTVVKQFTIRKKKLTKNNVLCYNGPFIYNGKKHSAVLKLVKKTPYQYETVRTLKKGRDYRIAGNPKLKNVGIYTLKVTGTKNYKGTVRMKVRVTPRAPVKVRAVKRYRNSIKVKWSRPTKGKIDGYIVYMYDGDPINPSGKICTKKTEYIAKCDDAFETHISVASYKYVKGKKVISISNNHFHGAVRPSGTPSVKVKVKKNCYLLKSIRYGSYQICVSRTSSFKKGTYTTYKAWLDTSSWLECTVRAKDRNKTRWIRIRQYAEGDNGTFYGRWSKARKVRF